MRKLLILILFPFQLLAQEKSNSELFWNTLQIHCGKAFEGKLWQEEKKVMVLQERN